nr:MAG: hypothetical protein DIU68_16440 [Chloroflexota bacterium]
MFSEHYDQEPAGVRFPTSSAFTIRALAFVILVFASAGLVLAQERTEVTPTPAPSKTPAPTATVAETEEATATEAATFRALTQADLSIVTGNVQRPNGITWHDDKLYISCSGDWTLYQLDATSGQTMTYIFGIRNAHTLVAEDAENGELSLWVPDFQLNTLANVTRAGVRPVTTDLQGPWGLAKLDDENFLVSNLGGNNVVRVSREGEVQPVVEGLRAPTGLAVDGDVFYVANNGSTRRSVEWYPTPAPDSDELVIEPDSEDSHSLVSGLQNVTGLVMGPDNYLYMAYSLGTRGVVGRVDPERCRENGGCTHDEVEIVLLTELAAPLAGLTISPDMRLYVHTMFSPDIYWASLDRSAEDA